MRLKLMKRLFIFLSILLISAISCSSQKQLNQNDSPVLEQATYSYWSVSVPGIPDGQERGIDLTFRLNNLPADTSPVHVIFDRRKSYVPVQKESTDAGRIYTARIILESAVLDSVSESSELSDRIVMMNEKGEQSYIPIENARPSGADTKQPLR
jgi:hypothetical protein